MTGAERVATLRAVNLLTGHDERCIGGSRGPCNCRLAERQEAARAIDARVEALETRDRLLADLHVLLAMDAALAARIAALLSEVKP